MAAEEREMGVQRCVVDPDRKFGGCQGSRQGKEVVPINVRRLSRSGDSQDVER